jgi:hypothetical protein
MQKLLTTILLSCAFLAAQAQLSRTKVESLISNNDTRNWQFKKYKKTLGSECSGDGQLFTFLKGGKAQRKRCVNGKIEFTEFTWELKAEGDESKGEWTLIFGREIEIENGNHVLSLRLELPHGKENTPATKMIWRTVPDCKSCIEQIITLSSVN